MTKNDEILKYSNPTKVYKKAKKLFGDDIDIKISTRKDKKYMAKFDFLDKWVHFGQMGYMDYTYHKDESRRDNFLRRNHKWASFDYFTPGYLSYVLLW